MARTGVPLPDARAWAASDKAKVATGRGYGSHDIDNPPHGPRDARVLGPEASAAGAVM